MITPSQAEQLIHTCSLHLEAETIVLEDALHRLLAEDLIADTDLPPFDRVMMDGIALNYDAIESGQRSFIIQSMQRAGQPALTLENADHCIEIMTGAVRSIGCDTVVPYEHLRIENGVAHIEIPPSGRGKNVHLQGGDKYKGAVLAKTGSVLGTSEIGIAASIGKHMLAVQRLPRVLICSTGDELVEIDETPLAHQISRSNAYALSALMRNLGIHASGIHLPDSADTLRESVSYGLNTYDVIILSGGVSKGKFDLLPEILSELRVDSVFHGIAQRPGKPMWFGKSNRTVVFALPGNPVSTLACAARYVIPWMLQQMGRSENTIHVALKQSVHPHEKLSLFVPVRIMHENGMHTAETLSNHGSGDFSALSGADGFIEIEPRDATEKRYRFFPM
ncbi:MAG: molybdopterin molybdotransferase MoeA [Flavobacteriales bacterium]